MPYLEIPYELADEIADWAGVYGGHDEICNPRQRIQDKCRICFTEELVDRIKKSVENEEKYYAMYLRPPI
ncbi:hypothetical protein HYS94_01665 [Candidatus Daviesbacteria bacterium]|nr:hypothetical protein [Candidatus Daviesbacteria bacterium]